MKSKLLIIAFFLFWKNGTYAQEIPAGIEQALSSPGYLTSIPVSYQRELNEFYGALDFRPVWFCQSGESNRNALFELLENAENEGLNKEDYQYEFISSSIPGTAADSLVEELRLSEAAIHFFSDMAYGNTRPAFGFDGLGYLPAGYEIPVLLASYCSKDQLRHLAENLRSISPDIKAINQLLTKIKSLHSIDGYQEEKIVSAQANRFNQPLLRKLYYLGITDSINIGSDKDIEISVKEAQRRFNLLSDGVLRATALKELNVPLAIRVKQLSLAINYYRWLNSFSLQQTAIVVNIPAAYLKVYGPGGSLLEMKMIVGKPSTPTPTLASRVNEVILYPYWMVPHSIAIKELLPAIKRNPGFLNENNFQVINYEGKIVDPLKINWQELNDTNFPYTLRQSTGCDNSLGLIKLNFYSPFGVYLHDTPDKNLFSLNKRYFSHGCMRMEKPMELGRLLLQDNAMAIDTLTEKGCILNQSPITLSMDEKMPVVVWYNPVGTDSTGRVIFYEDIYKKFRPGNDITAR